MTVPPYGRLYARATALAHRYMSTYRGAFVGAFLAAALAAASAVGLLTAMLWWGSLEAVPWWCLYPLGLVKIVILIGLLRLERAALAGRIQEHATDFRYLAELTRPMQWLAPLGAVVPAVEPPTEATPDTWRGWTPWLMRAWSRSAPLVVDPVDANPAPVATRLSLDGGRTSRVLESARMLWVGGQIDYHRRTTRTMHDLESGLEWIARSLLWVVLASAVCGLLIEAGLRLDHDLPALAAWLEPLHLDDVHGLHGAAVVLGAMAASLPAFIAALAGILFQSEARRLRRRSQAMQRHLEAHDTRLRSLAAALEDPAGPRGDDDALVAEQLRTLSVLVLSETGGWTILYQTHDIRAG